MKHILKENLKSAMKAQDRVRLETIRAVLSEMQYEEMQKGIEELSPADSIAVVQRELKKRQEAIGFAEQANRPEAKEKLLAEIAVLEGFLPSQLGAEDLERVVREFKAANPEATLNVVMKHLKDTYTGQYDGKTASEVARRVVG